MHLQTHFDVACARDSAVAIAARDETLVGLFPDSKTRIVERAGQRKTTETHYTKLGRSGTATFHFTYRSDGDIEFEKECDGAVWQELRGTLSFRERAGRTRVAIEMRGRTKAFVPEFTVKGAMQDQLEQMADALRERLQAG
ncbi:MAG: hypothetical protein OEY15_03850 [Myxococcales bacterium]|nr:hypothetical protein [Myxococcales bacterium]